MPALNRRYLLRVALVALFAFVIFRYIAMPFYIKGESMAPTYRTGNVTIGWRLRYLLSEPGRGDIVILRLPGHNTAHLKRVLALSGDEVEFRNGALCVNGEEVQEPYSVKPGNWNHGPVTVEQGYVYVVGDNRSMPREEHEFGSVRRDRIIGTPLW